MSTTRLQWIGLVDAKLAAELVPGDVTIWNGGELRPVLAVEELSPKFVRLVLQAPDGKTWHRRTAKTFLVGVTR